MCFHQLADIPVCKSFRLRKNIRLRYFGKFSRANLFAFHSPFYSRRNLDINLAAVASISLSRRELHTGINVKAAWQLNCSPSNSHAKLSWV